MGYHDKLRAEIKAVLDDLEKRGQPLIADWVTHEVCKAHLAGLAENEHAEFWRHGGFKTVRNETRLCINERVDGKPSRAQGEPWLPGFVHLQPYYMVERDGDEIGVRTPELTDEEIEAKAQFFDKLSVACAEHADELRRYKLYRRKAAE